MCCVSSRALCEQLCEQQSCVSSCVSNRASPVRRVERTQSSAKARGGQRRWAKAVGRGGGPAAERAPRPCPSAPPSPCTCQPIANEQMKIRHRLIVIMARGVGVGGWGRRG